MKYFKADLIAHIEDTILGEGPVWDYRRETLWWVDIMNGRLHEFDPKNNQTNTHHFDEYIGTAVPCHSENEIILALQHGFTLYNIVDKSLTRLTDPEKDIPANRFNDGKCDPAGRFWAGTMPIKSGAPNGSLYCLSANHSVETKLSDIYISNGLDWTADGKTFYFIDTIPQKLRKYDFDLNTGTISNKQFVLDFHSEDIYPDGMTMDGDGNLWIAFYDAAMVRCYHPNTLEPIAQIDVPASRVTSCAFGDTNLDTLYITTAQKDGEVFSGGLFRAKVGVQGRRAWFFRA